MFTATEREKIVAGLRGEYTKTELERKRSCLQTGIHHLGLAIQAFGGLDIGGDMSDLGDFLEEAVELLPLVVEALET